MCIRDRPYNNTGNNIPSCKTLAHSKLSPFTFTNDLIAPPTFLPFTTFLLHSASSVPFSSSIYPKYLNSDTCSSCSPSNITSHRGLSSLTTITLLLSTFTFKPLLLHNCQISLPILSNSLQIRYTKPNHPHIIGRSPSTHLHHSNTISCHPYLEFFHNPC